MVAQESSGPCGLIASAARTSLTPTPAPSYLTPAIQSQAPLAQLDRASDFESEGRRFESFGARWP
jgi:hypothetical protein